LIAIIRSCSLRLASLAQVHLWTVGASRSLHTYALAPLLAMLLLETTREHVYNVLWVLVFAFSTLNILSLGVRRLDRRGGLSFGEVIAIMVVLFSVTLLAWEMLYEFHILPIRLEPQ
jgi:hypothetical protein